MPTTRLSRSYSDPGLNASLQKGLSNIGQMFAPPSVQDSYLAAKMRADQEAAAQKAASLGQLSSQYPGLPISTLFGAGATSAVDAVKGGTMLDLYGQTQRDPKGALTPGSKVDAGNYAVTGNAGGTFQGQANTIAGENQRNAVSDAGQTTRALIAPIGKDSVQNIPPSIASLYSIPAQRSGVMELGQGQTMVMPGATGAPAAGLTLNGPAKPPTEDNVRAAILQGQPADVQAATVLKGGDLAKTTDAEGNPVYSSAASAIGKPVYEAQSGKTTVQNYRNPAGGSGTAAFDEKTGKWKDTSTGLEIPQGSTTYQGQVQANNPDQLGSSIKNQTDQQALALSNLQNTATRLRDTVAANPGAQGVVGLVRGTVQDMLATGSELGTILSQGQKQAMDDWRNGLMDEQVAARLGIVNGQFDPSIPAVDVLHNLLISQYQRSQSSDRMTDTAFRRTEAAFGAKGWMSNGPKSVAALNELIANIENQRQSLGQANPQAARQLGPLANPGQATGQQPNAPAAQTPAKTYQLRGREIVPGGGGWVFKDTGEPAK